MWQTQYIAQTDLAPGKIWDALRALETGQVPMASGDLRQADGPFEVGATIVSTPVGIDPLESTITELDPDRTLAVQTTFNGLDLLLRHVLAPLGDGGTRITRQLEISGAAADEQGPVAGPRISEDYPQALHELIAVARQRA